MTVSRCSKCGRELIEGKRFCGGCGQPTFVSAIPSHLEPPSQSCVKCGTDLAPGKGFCRQCGQPVGEPAPAATQTASVASALAPEPKGQVCRQCGSALIPGMRFCKACGHVIDAPVIVPSVEGGSAERQQSPINETEAIDLHSAAPVSESLGFLQHANSESAPIPATLTAAVESDLTFHPLERPTNSWMPPFESIEDISPASPAGVSAFGSNISSLVPHAQSTWELKIAIGMAVAGLAVAGVWAWHAHTHRSVFTPAQVPFVSQPPRASLPDERSKPSPSIPGPTATSRQQSQSLSGIVPPSAPSPSKAPLDSGQHMAKITSRPEVALTPAPPPLPLTPGPPHSGLLHYTGPPVAYNGKVVFDHLPQARLKFNFDRQAWTLVIKPNPDGSKRVTLISQKQGYQTNCDVSWEVVE